MENVMRGMRILIVEDEFFIRLLLTEFLRDEGFAITEAETGEQAIRLLDRLETFDLLLTDISLPGEANGNDVATKAKQLCPDIPVVYSSGRPGSLTNKIGPGDAFLSKPYRLADLASAVHHALAPAERHRVPA
jgi:CheY-like chemotaxis protein